MIWLIAFVVAALPIGTRILLGTATPGLHEYEAFFLYGTDVFTLMVLIVGLVQWRRDWWRLIQGRGGALLFVFLVAGASSVFVAPDAALSLYVLLRLILLISFSFLVGLLVSREKLFRIVLGVLAAAAVIEGCIGLWQFREQASIGLGRFGEPELISYMGAASTVRAEGGRFLRVYGTFPHPNIYAGFMALGICSLAYFYFICEQRISKDVFRQPNGWWRDKGKLLKTLNAYLTHRYFFARLMIAAASFIVIVGLILSFSRSGWLAAVAGTLVFIVLMVRYYAGAMLRLSLMLAACAVIGGSVFLPLIVSRGHVAVGQASVDDRITYMQIGLETLQDTPFGVGLGNQVYSAVQMHRYQNHEIRQVWRWEPIHNLYLLVGVEMGVLGLISFLGFLSMVGWQLVRAVTLEKAVVTAMLVAMLVTGLFDHYLWTLQPGRLMLWLVIGLCLSQLPLPMRVREK